MSKCTRLFGVLAIVAGLNVTNALANPIALKIQSGATTIIVSDNNVVISPAATNPDQNSALGEVAWSGIVGDWTLNVGLGLGSAVLGPGHMDLSYNASTTQVSPSAPLTIWFTEINVPQIPVFDVSIGGTNNRTSTQYDTSYDAGNGYFTTGTLIASSGLIASPLGSKGFSFSGSGANSLTPPFSTTEKVTIGASGTLPMVGGMPGTRIASGDAELAGTPVSEPSSLLLMGAGLAGLALFRRSKSAVN